MYLFEGHNYVGEVHRHKCDPKRISLRNLPSGTIIMTICAKWFTGPCSFILPKVCTSRTRISVKKLTILTHSHSRSRARVAHHPSESVVMGKAYTEEQRLSVKLLLESGRDEETIEKETGVSDRTIRRWKLELERTGRIGKPPESRTGRHRVLNADIEAVSLISTKLRRCQ
jgi:hypothetical protein